MQGVTTALVAFIFFCVIFPERVKNRTQFYAGFGLICLIILMDALSFMIGSTTEHQSFRVFAYFAVAILQIGAILTMFMAAGGLSWQELKGELGNAYEVIRRGEEKKEVIVPLSGEMPKPRRVADEPPQRIPLDDLDERGEPPPARPG